MATTLARSSGDFSGSGRSGILWRNSGGDTELWNPNGSGGFVGENLGVVPTNWQIVGGARAFPAFGSIRPFMTV